MPVAASRAGSIKHLAEQQRSAAGSPVSSGAADTKQPKRSVSTKASTCTPSDIFPEADTLPSTYTANSSSTTAAAGPSLQQQQQQDAADAALYRDMRSALADFETQQRKLSCMHASTAADKSRSRPARMSPRQTAFYAALRSVLQQVLAETTPAGRHTRLVAAHAWYVGHRPRPVAADANLAAAMAASLSISSPGQQQQQQQQRVGSPQGRGYGSRAHSPDAAGDSPDWDSDGCCSDPEQADAGQLDQQHYSTNGTSAAAEGAAARPMSAQHAQRLEAGARTAYVGGWPHGSSSNSGAADVPGLIPVGALPSSRFTACFPPNVQSSRPSTAAAAVSLSGSRKISTVTFLEPQQQQDLQYQQQQQQQQQQQFVGKSAWSAVMAQQAALESEVADSMHIFARQRARIEEDISRRQELAAVAAATAVAAAATGRGSPGRGSPGRFLQHMDSQHQPSEVTADLMLTATAAKMAGSVLAGAAAGGSSGSSCGSSRVQLVVPDRVKAARKQHQQEGVQEVSVLQESTGLPDSVLARALLPPPDVPYMSAFAQLPTYKPPPKAAAAKKKKKSGKSEKGGKGSNSKASKASKP